MLRDKLFIENNQIKIADLNYQLYLIFNNKDVEENIDKDNTEHYRKNAYLIYKNLYKKIPNIRFKNRFIELSS